MIDVIKIINEYSKKECYIEVLADGYLLEQVGICWRGYVRYKESDKWFSEDCGCYVDWDKAFKSAVEFSEYLKENKNGED